MKKITIYLIITLSLFISGKALAHGDIKTVIESRMSWGEAEQVAYIFDEAGISMALFLDPVIQTKEEAKKTISKFFKDHPPKECRITSQGKYRNGTRYFEGIYTTAEGKSYDAYFEASLDQDEGHYHLSLIRIEE